jgi:hypothetical protein
MAGKLTPEQIEHRKLRVRQASIAFVVVLLVGFTAGFSTGYAIWGA